MAADINWTGKSGRTYDYWFSKITDTYKPVAGNYMFVKPVANRQWLPVYIGQAADLHARLSTHDRWAEAAKAGATHVMTHTTPGGEGARLDEERDLIAFWQPVLNTHHRNVS